MTQTTIYATPAELAHWLDPDAESPAEPPLATVLLREASALVTRNLSAPYPTNPDTGLPRDAAKAEAIKTATLQQAEAWHLNSIDPRKGSAGLKPIVTTKSLGGAAVSYGQSAPVQQAIVALAAATDLVDKAWLTLQGAGLIATSVTTYPGMIAPRPWSGEL